MTSPTVDVPAGYVPGVAVSFGSQGSAATIVDDTHPLPVATQGAGVTYLNRSGAIAAGGAAQQVASPNAARRGFFLQNVSSGDLWISSVGAAVADQPALRIAPGQLYESPAHGVPVTAISVLGATTGQGFAAREW